MAQRPGSGRKRKLPLDAAPYATGRTFATSLEFLAFVIDDPGAPLDAKLRAAQVLAPFQAPKVGEIGKKVRANERAAEVSSLGAFAPGPMPQLDATVPPDAYAPGEPPAGTRKPN